MEKRIEKVDNERPKERINQFIIECMFSKYFEEVKDQEVLVKREKVAA